MKKIVTLMLTVLFVLSFTTISFAANDTNSSNPEIVKVYRITEDGIKEVSIEKYLNHPTLNDPTLKEKVNSDFRNATIDKKSEKDLSPQTDDSFYYNYEELGSTESRRTDLRERVSRIVENTTSQIVDYSISYNHTQGYEVSSDLNSGELSALTAGVSFSWHDELSVEDTATLRVEPDKRGWWEFDPLMNYSWGNMETWNFGILVSEERIDAHSPKEVSGMLDGYLIAVTEDI